MIKKFFLYIILPSVVLGMVYQSGRNDGRKQAIEDGTTVAGFSVTEKPIAEPMPQLAPVVERKPKTSAQSKKLPAKPKTEPVDRFVQRVSRQVIETDENVTPVTFTSPVTGRSVYDRVSPMSELQPLQPLEPMPPSAAAARTVISIKPSADCDCGKEHK